MLLSSTMICNHVLTITELSIVENDKAKIYMIDDQLLIRLEAVWCLWQSYDLRVGLRDGLNDGLWVGLNDGLWVGSNDGLRVGLRDCLNVGLWVDLWELVYEKVYALVHKMGNSKSNG